MEKFDDVVKGTTPVLVDYFATWCGPCKMMHPVLEELKKQLGDRIKILKIDIDNPANSVQVNASQIKSVPTLILFKEGKIVWRQSGAMQAPQLREAIEKYL